ncbi:hypothetical protein AWB77_05998 [Caballeronia fortuita]|uniref:Uncharacterized protein n=1 Tax=Caballeronia fortuita TaxID=1777138 RepID=A0A158E157_9BURK|nr:hypothetical protein [Caballeronia fortuita]SAK99667.1 hypothetical protein AWB77_05998 [Caballeronia fortuita]
MTTRASRFESTYEQVSDDEAETTAKLAETMRHYRTGLSEDGVQS